MTDIKRGLVLQHGDVTEASLAEGRRLQALIIARIEAESVAEMCGEQPQRFWETLRDECIKRLPAPPVKDPGPGPMSEQEARRFEQQQMRYGTHIGTEIGQTPVSYLLWMAEGDDFTRELRRYVASRTFADRQDQGE